MSLVDFDIQSDRYQDTFDLSAEIEEHGTGGRVNGGKCFCANKLPALCWWAVVCLFVSENRGHSERRRGNHFDQDRQNRDIWGNSWMVQARHLLRRKGKSVSPTKMCAWNQKEKSSLFLVLLYCAICYPVEGQRVWYQENMKLLLSMLSSSFLASLCSLGVIFVSLAW